MKGRYLKWVKKGDLWSAKGVDGDYLVYYVNGGRQYWKFCKTGASWRPQLMCHSIAGGKAWAQEHHSMKLDKELV